MAEVPFTYLLCQALYRSERMWAERFTGCGPNVGPKYGQFYMVDHSLEYKGRDWVGAHKAQNWIWYD